MMLGYLPATEAKAQGFTHHGKYFGIPVWLGDPDSEAPMVAAKWAPLEFAITVASHIEGTLLWLFFPEREPAFQLLVGRRIEE